MAPLERNEEVIRQFLRRRKWGFWASLAVGALMGFVFTELRAHPKLILPEQPYLVGLWLAAGASLALLVIGFLFCICLAA